MRLHPGNNPVALVIVQSQASYLCLHCRDALSLVSPLALLSSHALGLGLDMHRPGIEGYQSSQNVAQDRQVVLSFLSEVSLIRVNTSSTLP